MKIKEKKYDIFDNDNYIKPAVFARLSSKIFSYFGFIELFCGLFRFTSIGLGSKYLLILCAPIMTLYDYQKKYEMHIPPCRKKNFASCINLCVYIFFYPTPIALVIVLLAQIAVLISDIIKPLVDFIIQYKDAIIYIINSGFQ